MSHILAIVGRPNVGKSTLFNRIVGHRDAIVHDEPGVTRDRHYAATEWAGKTFTVIDTGGYVPQSKDIVERAIREQAEIAIEEASSIIFVVDAQSGATALDEELAAILRKSKKKIHLVVNKVDTGRREFASGEFHKFGLGEPIAISALVGRNIGDFLDEVTRSITLNGKEDEENPRLKLAVIGKPNVGKSSFVNAVLGTSRAIVTDIPGTTRDAIDSMLKYKKEEILLIDTAGLRRKSRVKESIEFYSTLRSIKSIERCDVAILMVDCEEGVDKQDLRILENIIELRRGVILAANKWDLIEKDDTTAASYERSLRGILRKFDYVPVIFISALHKQRVYKAIDLAKKVFAERQKRIPTNVLNTVMLKEIAASPPSTSSGKEIKIKYVTQVKSNSPIIAFFANEPLLVHEQYKRFLERKLREHFGFEGVPLAITFKKKSS